MADITVRSHTRKKPDRISKDPLKDMIEARKAILAARMRPREQWASSGWRFPRWFHSIADVLRGRKEV